MGHTSLCEPHSHVNHGQAREKWEHGAGWEGWKRNQGTWRVFLPFSCDITPIIIIFYLHRLSGHDNKRSRPQGNKTWPLFSRLPSRVSFPIRTSLTAVFALFLWSLGRESCSESVCTDSAGQRLQLRLTEGPLEVIGIRDIWAKRIGKGNFWCGKLLGFGILRDVWDIKNCD